MIFVLPLEKNLIRSTNPSVSSPWMSMNANKTEGSKGNFVLSYPGSNRFLVALFPCFSYYLIRCKECTHSFSL